MSDMSRSLAAFVLPLALGRTIEFILGTSVGKNLADSLGNPTLASVEGRKVVRKYSTAAAAVALGASFTFSRQQDGLRPARRDRAQTFGDVAELLLSAGALAKVASDYMRDQREVRRRQTALL